MAKGRMKTSFVLLLSLLLVSCGGGPAEKAGVPSENAVVTGKILPQGVDIEIVVAATLDGKPAAKAGVTVDNQAVGGTDEAGNFSRVIRKWPGEEVRLAVEADSPGYRSKPWAESFVVKLPAREGTMDRYSFRAELTGTKYITLAVKENGKPVEGASVRVSGKEVGKTGPSGEFLYPYDTLPKKGLPISVGTPEAGSWSSTLKTLSPGQTIEVPLTRRTVIEIACLTEEYGQERPVPDVAVSLDGKVIGKTDAKGRFAYKDSGKPGRKALLALSAPGFIPEGWEKRIVLSGEVGVRRYFYPAVPRPIRAGIYGFTGNTPGEDLQEVARKTQAAVGDQLFRYAGFREVPAETLHAEMKRARITVEKATAKGWRGTSLARTVDMIVLGSVAKDEDGYLIETRIQDAAGTPIASRVTRSRDAEGIPGAAREVTADLVERFPFEGTVVAVEEDQYRVNLGKSGHGIGRGAELDLSSPVIDASGKVKGTRRTGILKVRKADQAGSWAAVEDLKEGESVRIGDKVVRYVPREGETEGSGNVVTLSVRSGTPPDGGPIRGVNIYLNGEWRGSTRVDGSAELAVRLGKTYDLLLYRHGYRQATGSLRVDAARQVREFVLAVNNSLFRVDSSPSGAEVFVDEQPVGKTPVTEGIPVPLGFHTVRIRAGEEYRDFEEVMEFSRDEEDRTGNRRIVLFRDFLAIGDRAKAAGRIDAAIQAYAATTKEHPDFSEAHGRLGRIYLDDKKDYESAIREFESVLSLPQNRVLIYKQFAVMFTNLGHAAYERGNELVNRNPDAASRYFSDALKALQTARQNLRFFPTERYDEAVHDTYYYTALSYHKLYLLTRKGTLLSSANNAWREYFDFFPERLAGKREFETSRQAARTYWDQIRDRL